MPIPNSPGFAHHHITCVTSDSQLGPVVLMLQTEPNGRVTQFTLRLMHSTVLREAGEPLRWIRAATHLAHDGPVILPTPTHDNDDELEHA